MKSYMVLWKTHRFVICCWSLTQKSLRALLVLAIGMLCLRAGAPQFLSLISYLTAVQDEFPSNPSKDFPPISIQAKSMYHGNHETALVEREIKQSRVFLKIDQEACFSISVL